MKMGNRVAKVREKFPENRIEAILISQPDNLFYLAGCEGLEGYLLVTADKAVIVTDFRYVEQAERQSPHCEIFQIKGKMAEWFPILFSSFVVKRIGFESGHLSFSAHQQITEIFENAKLPVQLIPTSGVVESIRVVKDAEEIDLIAEAAKITGAALAHIEEILRPGMTEKTLAWETEKYMRDNGSQPVPFELIVAAGPNAALPHAKPSDYVIKAGEPVVVDIGSKHRYYGSDMTRTFCIGKRDEKFDKVYNTVLCAQQSAIAKLKPGMTGNEADAIAREIIVKAGYGDAFGHSLGHGIGLVTHENPRLGPDSQDILSEGMVFTVEPGIYLKGWGGVRIEDDVAIKDGKVRVISEAKK